jgi:hypothetical protein
VVGRGDRACPLVPRSPPSRKKIVAALSHGSAALECLLALGDELLDAHLIFDTAPFATLAAVTFGHKRRSFLSNSGSDNLITNLSTINLPLCCNPLV